MKAGKRALLHVALLLLTALLGVAGLTIRAWWGKAPLWEGVWVGWEEWAVQVAAGIWCGGAAAVVILLMVNMDVFKELREWMERRFRLLGLNWWLVLLYSVFAGVFEELLFRHALQPLIGLVPAALLFVAVHGYFRLKPRGMWIVGIALSGFSIVLGILYERIGFWSAAAAHATYDMAVLTVLLEQMQRLPQSSTD